MITLHISVYKGSLYLWSEGQSYGLAKELRQASKSIGLGLEVKKNSTSQCTAWLPSCAGIPLPSSSLMGIMPKENDIRLSPFTVTAKPLDIEQALELAAIAKNGNIPATGVIFGSSVFWVSHILNTALKLVAEEKFLPAILDHSSCFEARWMPVTGIFQEQELKKLSDIMPPVCRCIHHKENPPDMPRHIVINSLLSKAVDTLIRGSICPVDKKSSPESLHDAWVFALASKEAIVYWDNRQELLDFSRQLKDWARPVDVLNDAPFCFYFRLSEPDKQEDAWKVEYLLQPKSDQSTYMPVKKLWNMDQIDKMGFNPIEFMLTALGQASRLCPDISKSLKQKKPWGFHLDSSGAYSFLKEYTHALKASGFGVLLPSWWVGQGPSKKMGLKVQTKSTQMHAGSHLSLDTMIAFDYKVSLGDEELSLEELLFIAKLKQPLINVRGQWVQIDAEQINAAIDLLRNQKDRQMCVSELLAAALGARTAIGDLTIESVEAAGWIKELLDRLTGQTEYELLPQPDRFLGKLRPYQNRGFSWVAFLRRWGLGACLADDMGLGKTIQALALIQREYQSGEKRPVLVVCPTSVVNNWLKEAKMFAPELHVLVHHGSGRGKKDTFAASAQKYQMVISSYGLLQRDICFLKTVKWAGVILDEAQNIKNAETKQSKAARCLQADYRIALTGTPVENHVGDLWALMDFLNPGLLGSQAYFKNTFYKPIQIYGKKEAKEKLKSVTAPFILRRLKTDKTIIDDLPDKIEIKDYCNLTREQAALYQAVVDDMRNKVEKAEGIDRKGLVLSTIVKLKQVCNHPAQFAQDNSSLEGRSGKLQKLEEMLQQTMEIKDRVLIFTQYAYMGSLLQKHLQDYFAQEVFFLCGSLPKKHRDRMVECFQNDEHAPLIFILSLKAGGTGLNLTRANHVVHYDRWWNPAVEDQATDRIYRIGQKRHVAVRKFIVAGTLEEKIDEMIEKKKAIADQVIGSGEKWLTELSNKDFYQLIKLESEAVGE